MEVIMLRAVPFLILGAFVVLSSPALAGKGGSGGSAGSGQHTSPPPNKAMATPKTPPPNSGYKPFQSAVHGAHFWRSTGGL
jgi:hypothetical protein